MIKTMMAAAGLSIGLMMMPVAPAPAQAGVDIDVNIGGGGYGGGYGQISCRGGARLVANNGFYDIRVRDCNGSNYTYFGRRKGKRFIIQVNAKRGRIVDVRRVNNW